ALALAIALLLNTDIRGKGFYRTVYFLPVVTSVAAISIVWKWVYNAEYGLLNHWLGLERFDWLQQNEGVVGLAFSGLGLPLPRFVPEGPSIAMLAVIGMSIWKGLGYNVIIFLAGLQNIPKDLYEAARIDGAGAWESFRHVTWPLLSPTTYFVLVMTTISSFQVFAQVYMLYDGMPADSTRVIVFYLYETAFKSNRFGYASAVAYALFGIIFAMTMVQRRVAETRVHYQ
ncbi:MAG: sugar ABC transporter permease, partial [Candidatus Riflebacteria bacterium]|nr:sugar ABC transporter permease [Candidatus Riflebacteria bacterium]